MELKDGREFAISRKPVKKYPVSSQLYFPAFEFVILNTVCQLAIPGI